MSDESKKDESVVKESGVEESAAQPELSDDQIEGAAGGGGRLAYTNDTTLSPKLKALDEELLLDSEPALADSIVKQKYSFKENIKV